MAKSRVDRGGAVRRKVNRVKLGGITVSVRAPTADEVARNVAASTAALERVKDRLLSKGVKLARRKGVPLFYADPNRPGRFVRRLDGRTEYGVVVDGEFRVVD